MTCLRRTPPTVVSLAITPSSCKLSCFLSSTSRWSPSGIYGDFGGYPWQCSAPCRCGSCRTSQRGQCQQRRCRFCPAATWWGPASCGFWRHLHFHAVPSAQGSDTSACPQVNVEKRAPLSKSKTPSPSPAAAKSAWWMSWFLWTESRTYASPTYCRLCEGVLQGFPCRERLSLQAQNLQPWDALFLGQRRYFRAWCPCGLGLTSGCTSTPSSATGRARKFRFWQDPARCYRYDGAACDLPHIT